LIQLLSAQSTVGPSANVDTDGDFHTYRIEIFGDGSVDVYYDDALTLEGQTYPSAGDHGAEVRVGWGPLSVVSMGQTEWRSFGHDGATELCGDGVLDPGEECDQGDTLPGDGCDALCQVEVPVGVCAVEPVLVCLDAAKASLSVQEKKAGSEKWKASLKGFDGATAQADLGDPLTATRYDLCLYGAASELVAELSVDRAGESCGPKQKPCFKDKGGKGWLYKDPAAEASGTRKLVLASGPAGKGKAVWQAGNKAKKGQTALPTGTTALLAGAGSATLQLVTSDAACFQAVLGTVKKNDATQFKAKAP
jgi:cysteine-rich repeat protein